jgi:hypothetical protein
MPLRYATTACSYRYVSYPPTPIGIAKREQRQYYVHTNTCSEIRMQRYAAPYAVSRYAFLTCRLCLDGHVDGHVQNVRHDHTKAEQLYKRALLCDPGHVSTLCNYATMLTAIRKDYQVMGHVVWDVV